MMSLLPPEVVRLHDGTNCVSTSLRARRVTVEIFTSYQHVTGECYRTLSQMSPRSVSQQYCTTSTNSDTSPTYHNNQAHPSIILDHKALNHLCNRNNRIGDTETTFSCRKVRSLLTFKKRHRQSSRSYLLVVKILISFHSLL